MYNKTTKGEWVVKDNPINKSEIVVMSGSTIVCRVNKLDFDTDEEGVANAHAISALPELLEGVHATVIEPSQLGVYFEAVKASGKRACKKMLKAIQKAYRTKDGGIE